MSACSWLAMIVNCDDDQFMVFLLVRCIILLY